VASHISIEKTSLYIFTCISFRAADQRRKIGGTTVPLAAASQIVITRWQTAHHVGIIQLVKRRGKNSHEE
jgi:hypothetical protein